EGERGSCLPPLRGGRGGRAGAAGGWWPCSQLSRILRQRKGGRRPLATWLQLAIHVPGAAIHAGAGGHLPDSDGTLEVVVVHATDQRRHRLRHGFPGRLGAETVIRQWILGGRAQGREVAVAEGVEVLPDPGPHCQQPLILVPDLFDNAVESDGRG